MIKLHAFFIFVLLFTPLFESSGGGGGGSNKQSEEAILQNKVNSSPQRIEPHD